MLSRAPESRPESVQRIESLIMQPIEPSTTATPPPPRPAETSGAAQVRKRPRSLHLALFFGCIALYRVALVVAAGAASGFAGRFDLGDEQPLLEAVAFLFLVVVGIGAMHSAERRLAPLRWSLGLPKRPTAGDEWGTGAALGWGIALVSVLAMVLARSINLQLWIAPRAFWLLSIGAVGLALTTLAKTLVLYGYGFQHLIEATSPAKGTLILVCIVLIDAILTPSPESTANGARVLVTALGALLLCLCWIRTRAVWLGWGAWFGWAASTALLFGLPLGPGMAYTAVVDARAGQPVWLTGGDYGPAASGFLVLLLVAAVPVLVRATSDYAWNYTRKPLVPAGIPVEIPAPAAHASMEQAPPPPPPALVQIQPLGPASEDAGLE